MTRSRRVAAVSFTILAPALAGALVAGCAPGARPADETAAAAAPPAVVQIGRENIVEVTMGEIRTGPVISGALTAALQSTVRAQIAGALVELTVDEGQSVRKGEVIGRIDDRDLRVAADSARAAVRSTETALRVAESEAARTDSLVKAGALASRDLELARNAVEAAQAQVAGARARLAAVEQQLGDTTIRSPLSGIVSETPAHAGDIVTNGTALVTIIDPSSMRLEASVPSDQLTFVKVGSPVQFEVRGYPGQTFSGRIERVSPVADPATRQVSIFVSVPNTGGRLIGGLFAEGRIATAVRQTLVVPSRAVDTTGVTPTVTVIRDGKVARVPVELGLRDEQTEWVEILSGAQLGERVVTGAAQQIAPGTPVAMKGEPGTL
jgi:membrane fusion protein (multidrug efflux system)